MRYDLAIIGGGPAGYSAAFHAVEAGLSTVIFEERELGGTCLNRGCVPTKFWAHAGEICCQLQKTPYYGMGAEQITLDFRAAKRRNEEIISGLRTGLEQRLKQNSVVYISKCAFLKEDHTIISGENVFEAENILIATGSRPSLPFLTGAITSDEILELDHLPKSVRIIGGGVVAMEFAHIFNLLGTKVKICIRGERILRKWDREIAISLSQLMKKRGIQIQTLCTMEQMQVGEEEIVLSATGRVPNVETIYDPTISIITDEDGIIVDAYGRTNIQGIYAAGDVVSGSPLLAHVAMDQGKRVVDYIIGKDNIRIPVIVSCIYLQPEIASVGMTENEAKDAGISAISAKQTMYANARTLIDEGERGFIKLVADREKHRLIGAQLMCERAGDIVSEIALAINRGVSVEDFASSLRPHPSFCEELTSAAKILVEKLS